VLLLRGRRKWPVVFLLLMLTFIISVSSAFAESYKEWPEKTDVPTDKIWTIKFNMEIKLSNISDNIYVASDVDGINKIPNITVENNVSNPNISVVVKPPTDGWVAGETYYLFINRNIASINNKLLAEPIRMKFVIKSKDENFTDDDYSIANYISNMNNGGFVAINNEYLYCTSWIDNIYSPDDFVVIDNNGGLLYKIDSNTSNILTTIMDYGKNLNIVGNEIYVKNNIEINKFDLDYNKKVNIVSDGNMGSQISFDNNWIYYLSIKKEQQPSTPWEPHPPITYECDINKMKIDGNESVKIFSENQLISNIVIGGDCLYYVLDKQIFKINKEGTGKVEVTKCTAQPYSLTILGNWIYYIDSRNLYRIKLNGTEQQKIDGTENINTFNIYKDKVYFVCDKIYQMDLEGRNKVEVTDYSVGKTAINIIDGWIYYKWGIQLYKVKIDGTSSQKVVNLIGSIPVMKKNDL
jgi:hypothetical protein